MSRPRILAFAGSTRQESFNVRLIHIAAEGGGFWNRRYLTGERLE